MPIGVGVVREAELLADRVRKLADKISRYHDNLSGLQTESLWTSLRSCDSEIGRVLLIVERDYQNYLSEK